MKRLLFITHRVPYPPDKGERLRAFHEVKVLSQHFRVTLAALARDRLDFSAAGPLKQWCEEVIVAPAGGRPGLARGALSLLAGGSVTEGYFRSRRLPKLIAAAAGREPFDLVLIYSSGMLACAAGLRAAAHVIDLVDVDSAKWLAYAARDRWPLSALYSREARAVRRLEERAVQRCDAALVVSQAEAAALGVGGHKIQAISNGVDADFFDPRAVQPIDLGPASLVFTGQMDYRPNVEGVRWFASEVWPGLKRQAPELSFTIVGRSPARAVRRLARLPGVKVTGQVPDVRPYLAGADVAVCPLWIARGIQNKVLEAMAMAKPVVASPPVLEGLEVRLDQEVLQADAPAQWQRRILDLLGDAEARRRLGRSARACVVAKYGWDSRLAPLVSLCQGLAANAGAARQANVAVRQAQAVPNASPQPEDPSPVTQPDRTPAAAGGLSRSAARIATLLAAAALTTVSLLPSAGRKPGGWDSLLSPNIQNILHVPAYAVLTVLAKIAFVPPAAARVGASQTSRPVAGWLAAGAACAAFGGLLEVAQVFVPGRYGSVSDALLNILGVSLGIAALLWLRRPAPPASPPARIATGKEAAP